MKITTFLSCFLSLCLITSKSVKAQTVDTTALTFEMIDTVDGTADQLFVKAMEWVATTYNSANDVVQLSDKVAGKIVGKGYKSITLPFPTEKPPYPFSRLPPVATTFGVTYTFTIDIKEGKYRHRLTGFRASRTGFGMPIEDAFEAEYTDPNSIKDKKSAELVKYVIKRNKQEIANAKYITLAYGMALLENLKEAMRKPADTF